MCTVKLTKNENYSSKNKSKANMNEQNAGEEENIKNIMMRKSVFSAQLSKIRWCWRDISWRNKEKKFIKKIQERKFFI